MKRPNERMRLRIFYMAMLIKIESTVNREPKPFNSIQSYKIHHSDYFIIIIIHLQHTLKRTYNKKD